MHLLSRPHQRPGEEQPRHDGRRPRLRRMRSAVVAEARPGGDVVLPTLQEAAVLLALQLTRRRPDRRLPVLRPRRSLRSHEAVVRSPFGMSHWVWMSLPCVGLKASHLTTTML